ncbi:uncharacterized protein MONBRDRAFT_27246 [Monosiga brevicollis MX1]|uniref:Uncharacterized protein n=1 Tax=Monosiga brevicollis TaxID=81824 RepID=A9V4Q9_MONBE|nr:uncharacterized protein MONBRDRAFT_27246 [Monosiga brevicollis MX1]EDQ87497.1 predicted protein [Monosiga brevicollis MX1]|eukprot:XP_001747757.1 hypothetical protein [Monosiga brevicollis MX1]
MKTVLGGLAVLFMVSPTTSASSELTLQWVFNPVFPNGSSTYITGPELRSFLGDPTVEFGTQLRFSWTNSPHGLLELSSQAAFDACDLTGVDTVLLQSPTTSSTNLAVSMDRAGRRWFVDNYASNCGAGMKVQVDTLGIGTTLPPTTTTTAPPDTSFVQPSPSDATIVTWHWTSQPQPDVHIPENGFVRFQWDQAGDVVHEFTNGPQDTGDILLNGTFWSIGWHYFITSDPAICGAGTRVRVYVSPADVLYWVTVWPHEEAQTDGFFEVQQMNVGLVSAVNLILPPGGVYKAHAVRVQPANQATDAQTFYCALDRYASSMTTPLFQTCVAHREVEPELPPTNLTRPAYDDGCFTTADDGLAGWAEMTAPTRLLGFDQLERVVGRNALNETIVSQDGGITWQYSLVTVNLIKNATSYSFDVEDLHTIPRSENTFHVVGTGIEWGVTPQGMHVNHDGTWILSAMWSCSLSQSFNSDVCVCVCVCVYCIHKPEKVESVS